GQWMQQDPPLRILEERQWSLDSGSVESTWSFVGETISSYRVWMRIYTYRELCELLRAAGFSRFEAFETGTQNTVSARIAASCSNRREMTGSAGAEWSSLMTRQEQNKATVLKYVDA